MWQTFPFTLLFRKGNIRCLYSNQNGRGVGRETQRQMKLPWRFPVAGLPLLNSVLRFARKFITLSILSRSKSCAETTKKKKKKRKGTCFIKCPSTRSWIVLKTESSFSPFKAFRHQKCRFSKNGPQSGVFSCKRWLVRDLSEFTQQDGRKKRLQNARVWQTWQGNYLRVLSSVSNLCFRVFYKKISLKESEVWRKAISKQNYCHASVPHKVCRLLTSPVLLCKFTLKIRGRRRQVKRRFKSEFAVFQSSSRLFRRCLFKVHDVTRDDSQRRFLAQHRVQMLEQRCSLSKRRRNNVLTLYVLR